jgi:hypothetical protein
LRLEPLVNADDEFFLQAAQGFTELVVGLLLGIPGEVEVEPDRPRPGLVDRIDDVGEVAAIDGQEVGKGGDALLGDPDDGDLGVRRGQPLREPSRTPVGGPMLRAQQGRLYGRDQEDGEEGEQAPEARSAVVPRAYRLSLWWRLDDGAHTQGPCLPVSAGG